MTDTDKTPENTAEAAAPHPRNIRAEARRRDFWMSILVLILVIEFFISVAALCYGIITTPPRVPGKAFSLAFPWLGWFAAMIIAPALLAGLARLLTDQEEVNRPAETAREKEWSGQLPPKARRIYRLIKGAPLLVVCLAFVALGATVLTIDSAFELIRGVALALIPYAPYFIGGITVLAVAVATLMAWFRYKNNKLAAEYAFKHEVLEKTGIVLMDDERALLPQANGRAGYTLIRLPSSDRSTPLPGSLPALPSQGLGDSEVVDSEVITVEKNDPSPTT